MIIPLGTPGRKYKATVKGRVDRLVACERCGCQYVYRMTRDASGTGTSFLGLDNSGAQRRAAVEAQTGLQRQLERECDAVPCPDCGWLQWAMVRKLRGEAMALLVAGAVVLWIVTAIVLAVSETRLLGPHPYLLTLGIAVAIPVVGAIPVYVIYDPNAKAAQRKAAGPDQRAVRLMEWERRRAEEARQQAEQMAQQMVQYQPPQTAPRPPPPLIVPGAGPPLLGPGRAGPAAGPPPIPPR